MARSGQPEHLAGPPPKRGRCKAKTKAGKRCTRGALDGADRCAQHIKPTSGTVTKLTDEIVEEIITILRFGGYVETAAAAAGVTRRTFREWLDLGNPEGTKVADAPFRQFRENVEQAIAEGEQRKIAVINRASETDWKAAAWMLERQFPDRWAGPRGRRLDSSIHPDDFAAGEASSGQQVVDDQMGPDGRPL